MSWLSGMAADTQHILLIEDSAAYARLIKGIFAEAAGRGFEVTRAATLQEGLEALETGRVDAVLLDLTLPDAEGLDTFRR